MSTDFTKFAIELKHPRYFPGQYLLDEDFELQHKYLSDRQRYQNRSLHVSGIIEGLEVDIIDQQTVRIKSGSAINNLGELIVLIADLDFQIVKDITSGELYIQYFEDKQVKQQEDVDDSYTRWMENPLVGFAITTPDNGVKLATLTISDGGIIVDANSREYSGLSLPNSNGEALTLRSGGNANPDLAVLTGSLEIDGNLKITGDIRAGNSDLYFTKTDHNHTAIGDATGYAAIENAANFDALMILGRAGTSKGRSVKLWDYLQVIGGMDITGNVGIGIDDPDNYRLNVQGDQYLKGSLTIQEGKVNLDSDQQIIFADGDTTNNLKIKLGSGSGLGINEGTLFHTADGNHSWRDKQNNERMLLTTDENGGLAVKGTGTSSFAGNLTVSGAITPSVGNSTTNGIMFPENAFGSSSGDAAWIRYYRRGGNGIATTFEIGTSNDTNDHIALMPGNGGVGIGIEDPGSYKLHVDGNQYIKGDLTVSGIGTKLEQQGWITPALSRMWADYDPDGFNSAGYFKDSLGIVHLKGLVRMISFNPLIQTPITIFTLDEGYRPSKREVQVVMTAHEIITRVDIQANGAVGYYYGKGGMTEWVSLDGITFRAA